MSADVTTIIIAVLGVAGTLSSPLLVQRSAARAKQQEFEMQRQERRERQAEENRRKNLGERRAIYASFNTAARQYTQEMRAFLRLIREDAVTDESRSQLIQVRQTYRDLYSDAQMILPDKVMDAAATVNDCLGEAYGLVRRLEAGRPREETADRPAETFEMAHEFCSVRLYDLTIALRQLMREDLGVSASRTA